MKTGPKPPRAMPRLVSASYIRQRLREETNAALAHDVVPYVAASLNAEFEVIVARAVEAYKREFALREIHGLDQSGWLREHHLFPELLL